MTKKITGRLILATKWPLLHPEDRSIAGIRHLIFHAKENGFDSVVVRLGRRCYLDEDAYYLWAAEHRASEVGKK